MKKVTEEEIHELSNQFGVDYAKVKAFIEVESGGKGFDDTGVLIIQFEPAWFKNKAPYTPSGLWSQNGVERQVQERIAFNDAYKRNKDAALESTSIGLMQVMGFNYKRLGFATVGEMWDFAKVSEKNHIWLGLEYLRTDKVLFSALQKGNWKEVALRYNGKNYAKLGYDKKLAAAEKKYL
jgi:hypothetical protein